MDTLSTSTSMITSLPKSTAPNKFDVCNDVDNILDVRSFEFDDIREELFYHPIEKSFILVISPILVILGLFGNVGFLAVVVKLPEMRTFTNAFLANLAICDILFSLVTAYNFLGVYVYSTNIESDPYSTSLGCWVVFGLIHLVHYTSTVLVVLMSLERYFGICKPLLHRKLATKSRIRNAIIFSWIVGFVFSFLIIPRLGKLEKTCILWPDDEEFKHLPSVIGECEPVHEVFNYAPFIVQAVPFFTASSISVFIYGSIIVKLHSRVSGQLTDEQQRESDVHARRLRNQVARLLIITGSVFIFCYFPYYILGVNEALLGLSDSKIGFDSEYMGLIFVIVRFLLLINSIANPVIYSLTNSRYRMAFVTVLCRINIRRHAQQRSNVSSLSSSTRIMNSK